VQLPDPDLTDETRWNLAVALAQRAAALVHVEPPPQNTSAHDATTSR